MERKQWAETIFNQWLQSMEDRGIMPKGTTEKFKMVVEEEILHVSPAILEKDFPKIASDWWLPQHLAFLDNKEFD